MTLKTRIITAATAFTLGLSLCTASMAATPSVTQAQQKTLSAKTQKQSQFDKFAAMATRLWDSSKDHKNFYVGVATEGILSRSNQTKILKHLLKGQERQNKLLEEILHVQIMQCTASPQCNALFHALQKQNKG